MVRRVILLFILHLGVFLSGYAQSPDASGCESLPDTSNCKLVDDFESGTPGNPPTRWKGTQNKEHVPLTRKMKSTKTVYVREEDGNRFARVHTEGTSFRIVRSRKKGLNWNVRKRPYLQWSWRAKALPEGGNEKYDRKNDTGGALYVTFGTDWLGRPKSIKYTYSSTLPVGTTVDYGPLQVLVVASKAEQGLDEWITHDRNVVEDYKRLFGESPDSTPLSITMWSDSDTLDDVGTIDFDNILLLSQPVRSQSSTASE